jgi:hypothetical protein
MDSPCATNKRSVGATHRWPNKNQAATRARGVNNNVGDLAAGLIGGRRSLLEHRRRGRAGGALLHGRPDRRVRWHCRSRNRGIECVRGSGMKWMGGGAKRQCNRALSDRLPHVLEVGGEQLQLLPRVRRRSSGCWGSRARLLLHQALTRVDGSNG